ncbi:hypothetical protein Ddye_028546 [Dipteronia dyeriana]|uniref:Uncharacterized protein n=1 Tax=Dipteronia dyeriana TaxID=168575 RepID=A0AAD9TDV4_9ROSI|nr:hypothetical protein Ddye_028546 [Dipteronia dyeriana]
MDARKLVIHHDGSCVGNCYEGGMTNWVNVLRGVSYYALVKLVDDVAKVDAARYNLKLWSLAYTTSGTARPRIENDNDVSCMMNIDKLLAEVSSATGNMWIHSNYRPKLLERHGCAGPLGCATFNGVSFREDGLGDDVDQTSEHASPQAGIIPRFESEKETDDSEINGEEIDSLLTGTGIQYISQRLTEMTSNLKELLKTPEEDWFKGKLI